MRAVLGAERFATRAVCAPACTRNGDARALCRADCRVPHFHGLLVRSADQTRAVRQGRPPIANDVRGSAVRAVDVAGLSHLTARQRCACAIAACDGVGARCGARGELPARDLAAETGEPAGAGTTTGGHERGANTLAAGHARCHPVPDRGAVVGDRRARVARACRPGRLALLFEARVASLFRRAQADVLEPPAAVGDVRGREAVGVRRARSIERLNGQARDDRDASRSGNAGRAAGTAAAAATTAACGPGGRARATGTAAAATTAACGPGGRARATRTAAAATTAACGPGGCARATRTGAAATTAACGPGGRARATRTGASATAACRSSGRADATRADGASRPPAAGP